MGSFEDQKWGGGTGRNMPDFGKEKRQGARLPPNDYALGTPTNHRRGLWPTGFLNPQ